MDSCQNFANNLNTIRRFKNYSLKEFAQRLDIPKSTLQSILEDGNTSLNTALYIAERLEVPLSTLTGEIIPAELLDSILALMKCLSKFADLPGEAQDEIIFNIRGIVEVLKK